MGIEWIIMKEPVLIPDDEQTDAQKACAEVIRLMMLGQVTRGVGEGSFRIPKWEGQRLLWMCRRAITVPEED